MHKLSKLALLLLSIVVLVSCKGEAKQGSGGKSSAKAITEKVEFSSANDGEHVEFEGYIIPLSYSMTSDYAIMCSVWDKYKSSDPLAGKQISNQIKVAFGKDMPNCVDFPGGGNTQIVNVTFYDNTGKPIKPYAEKVKVIGTVKTSGEGKSFVTDIEIIKL